MTARVAVLTTGGTIAQRSQADGRATPGFNPDSLVGQLDVGGVGATVREVFAKGGKDIVPADWQVLAAAVADAVDADADGVVVLHGTDTLHYTAAALSFLLSDLPVPVVLTGSMIPGGDTDSDARDNLRAAVLVAARADLAEVCVVFSAGSDPNPDSHGDAAWIIRGNRAKKVHSSAVAAFASVNAPPLGAVRAGRIDLGPAAVRRAARRVVRCLALEPNVILIKLTPAVGPTRLVAMLAGTAGAVLEGTGVGHLHADLHDVVRAYGRPTVLSTQTVAGGEQLGRYASDQLTLALPNAVPGGSMSPETALVKLMWALAQPADTVTLMRANVAGELDNDAVGHVTPGCVGG